MLNTLTPREEKVLRLRFGLSDGCEHTLEEVGQDFAVTRERIRQIEAKALRKLRHPVAVQEAPELPGIVIYYADVGAHSSMAEQPAHNRSGPGSTPGGPTTFFGAS